MFSLLQTVIPQSSTMCVYSAFLLSKVVMSQLICFACEINLLFNGAESGVRLFPLAACFLRTYAMKIHLVFATRGSTLQLANVR